MCWPIIFFHQINLSASKCMFILIISQKRSIVEKDINPDIRFLLSLRGITVFKIFIWVGMSLYIRSEIKFYGDARAEP